MPFLPNDPWLMPFFRRVNTRPGMFLGDERVRTLDTYIQAYSQARTDLGLSEFGAGEESILADFGRWLGAKLGDTRDVGWASLVARHDPGEHSAKVFFLLFEEFLNERGDSLLRSGPAWPPDAPFS